MKYNHTIMSLMKVKYGENTLQKYIIKLIPTTITSTTIPMNISGQLTVLDHANDGSSQFSSV